MRDEFGQRQRYWRKVLSGRSLMCMAQLWPIASLNALTSSGRAWTIVSTFFADMFGCKTVETAKSAPKYAEIVHTWLGAQFEQKKNLLPSTPGVLGVTYNFEKIALETKDDRRNLLTEVIRSILMAVSLEPGPAGKL